MQIRRLRTSEAKDEFETPEQELDEDQDNILSEEEIDDIVAYVMSWSVQAEPVTSTATSSEPSPWAGWGGLILTILLFGVVVGVILLFQLRQQE